MCSEYIGGAMDSSKLVCTYHDLLYALDNIEAATCQPRPVERLASVASIISEVCNISGVPSAAIGVIDDGKVVFTESFGYSDVSARKCATADTIYGIGSLTKGFTAASAAHLFDKVPSPIWSRPIKDILPDYVPKDSRLDRLVSPADFLSHRTGLFPDMSVAVQGDQEFLLSAEQLIPAVSDIDTVASFREEWLYNNWGYSIIAKTIEKLSGKPYHQYVREAVIDPLGLTSTSTRPVRDSGSDFAEAYAALDDGSFQHLPQRLPFKDSLFEASGGMYSTVNDMLKYANAVLQANEDPKSSPLKNIKMLLSNQVPLDNPSHLYRFYGMGWVLTQLPGVVGLQGDNAELFAWDELPILGFGSPPRMAFYHQGAAFGYYSSIFLFPETRSAVVVLTNSIPLNDAADWIAQVYVSALFGFPANADYIKLARESRARKVGNVVKLKSRFDAIRHNGPDDAHRPLEAYIGKYYNRRGNFFLDIRPHSDAPACLQLVFQGKELHTYELRHLRQDTFEWALDYNASASRARFTIWDSDYFVVDFKLQAGDKRASSLTWAKWEDAEQGMELLRKHEPEDVPVSPIAKLGMALARTNTGSYFLLPLFHDFGGIFRKKLPNGFKRHSPPHPRLVVPRGMQAYEFTARPVQQRCPAVAPICPAIVLQGADFRIVLDVLALGVAPKGTLAEVQNVVKPVELVVIEVCTGFRDAMRAGQQQPVATDADGGAGLFLGEDQGGGDSLGKSLQVSWDLDFVFL
ncbi:beta-lactamase/transpeptidase-like protein [Podospora appendiculata]|uniref:Beta-lactamase/transpeptidase-like protein n=1 Tax=Podospora appendiculata TaxID=314037 RepID=A0AAE0X8Q0_9PEZI|nr:beta-lactamase/transpeptidase-like protein [Podospora appendiculata]